MFTTAEFSRVPPARRSGPEGVVDPQGAVYDADPQLLAVNHVLLAIHHPLQHVLVAQAPECVVMT